MRALHEYSLVDWKRLRPLTHAYKTVNYRAETAIYVRRNADGTAALAARLRARNRPTLAVTIAYEAPWVIELQIAAARRHFNDVELVICDNSRREETANEIAAICRGSQVEYLRLPPNPRSAGSRSHALAINWAYRNLVCAVKPACFAFLDHDMIPTAAVDFVSLVRHQPFFGKMRHAGHRWYLWAGYCVFERSFCTEPILDFSQDWFIDLDTGGANYRRIYRNYNRDQLRFAHNTDRKITDPLTGTVVTINCVDEWIHFNNVSGWDQDNLLEPALLKRVLKSLIDD